MSDAQLCHLFHRYFKICPTTCASIVFLLMLSLSFPLCVSPAHSLIVHTHTDKNHIHTSSQSHINFFVFWLDKYVVGVWKIHGNNKHQYQGHDYLWIDRRVNGSSHCLCLQMMQTVNYFLEHRRIFETKEFENYHSIASKFCITFEVFIWQRIADVMYSADPPQGVHTNPVST